MTATAVTAWHTRAALAVTVVGVAALAVLPEPGPAARAGVLAGLVAVLGLPHGAVDHIEGRALLEGRAGRRWWLVFGALYIAAAAAVVAAWLAWPPGLLAGFLVLAAAHFGAEDVAAEAVTAGSWARVAEIAARGAVPVAGPPLLHPERTGTLFAYLLPGTPAGAVRELLHALAPAAWALGAALAVLIALALVRRRWRVGAELAALSAAVAVLPPLLAFVVYFCVWHSPRHSITVMGRLAPGDPGTGARRHAHAAWPLTLASIAGMAAAWAWLSTLAAPPVPALIATVFVGLAALTVPHVVLAALHARAVPT